MSARRCYSVVLAATVLAVAAVTVTLASGTREAGAQDITASARTCGGKKIELNADERRSLELHNRARERRDRKPLCVHPALQRAARAHSAAMIKKDRFFHGSVGKRLKRHGYRWKIYGENIAWGSGRKGSPESVFRGWMKSPTHRKNILKRGFREVGIGTATGTFKGHKGVTTYTADFGSRR